MAQTTFNNPIFVKGKGNPDVNYGPWNSVNEYKNYVANTLLTELKIGTTIGIIENGAIVEYWNNEDSSTFTKKSSSSIVNNSKITIKQGSTTKGEFNLNQSGDQIIILDSTQNGSTVQSGECATFIIDIVEYGITPGYMEKGSNGHYSSTQYSQMRQNALGISRAISDAYNSKYSRVLLPNDTYCFCTREYSPVYKGGTLPSLNLIDLNNIEIDFGGSKLCLLIDSLEYSPYISDTSANKPWFQGGILMAISYCNNILIKNADFVGDRFIRDYATSETQSNSYLNWESSNESTYGIYIQGGNNNIVISDCNFTGFMGDGVSAAPSSYFYDGALEETQGGNGCRTIVSSIMPNSALKGWDAFPEKTYRANFGKPSQQQKNENTCITPLYKINSQTNKREAIIDVSKLYSTNLNINNRKEHKDNHMFMIASTGGYNRLPGCYPGSIGVLTYDTIDGDAPQPLRYFETSYMNKFQLSPTEKYLRLQYSHEDHCAPEWDSSIQYSGGDVVIKKVSNPMFRYKCIKNMPSSGAFNEIYWQRYEYEPSITAPTYDSSKVYGVGEEVYYYALLSYTPLYAGQTGVWNVSNWEVLPCRNPNTTANYNPAQSYALNTSVTNIATEIYVPYKANIANSGAWNSSSWKLVKTDKPWFPSVNPLVAISELHTYGVELVRCNFINSHRGNVSNMPNDTVLRDCYFKKYLHTPGDGFQAPNFAGSLAGSLGETTNYSIDLEDYVASSFKLYNCKFESSDLSTGKVLLNTLNQTIDNCSGEMLLCVYGSNSSTYITNNNFDRFSFTVFPGNNRTNINAHRFWRKLIILQNNKLNMDSLSPYDPYGQDIRFVGNSISADSMVAADHYYYDPYKTGHFSFDGNYIDTLKKPSKIFLNAESITSCNFSGDGTEYELYSPCKCSGVSFYGENRLTLHPGLDKTDVSGFSAKCGEYQITIPNNGLNKSYIYIKNCEFESETNTIAPFNFYFKYGGHEAHECDIYFENVSFINLPSSTAFNYCTATNSVNGDKLNLHFKNCIFNTKNAVFVNNSIFTLAECKDCTFIRNITFNGTNITNN